MKIVWNIDRGSDAHAIIMSLSALPRQARQSASPYPLKSGTTSVMSSDLGSKPQGSFRV
jgi:hypothetical protein